jgi:ribosome-associated toxin RatA of RatAB toxin-antitoxin module
MSLDAAQEVTVEIAASQADCFAAILDFERYPDWSGAVAKARIVERDSAGIGRIVEFKIDAKVKTIRYVLAYQHKKPSQLTWHSIEGDVESIEGVYRFRKLGSTKTEAACRQEIKLGFWLPGPLRKLAERTALAQSVNEFKDYVENLQAQPAPRARRGKSS